MTQPEIRLASYGLHMIVQIGYASAPLTRGRPCPVPWADRLLQTQMQGFTYLRGRSRVANTRQIVGFWPQQQSASIKIGSATLIA